MFDNNSNQGDKPKKEYQTITDYLIEKIEKTDKSGNFYWILKLASNQSEPVEVRQGKDIFAFSRRPKGSSYGDPSTLDWCQGLEEGWTYELTFFVSDRGTKILQSFNKINTENGK